ncbi:hypothetical protein ACUOFC_45840, partial [Escherichia sp. TWPC-MK]
MVEMYYAAETEGMASVLADVDKYAQVFYQKDNEDFIVLFRAMKDGSNEIIHKYSAVYLKKIHTVLSSIFNFAIKFYGLTSNPARIAGNFEKESNKRLNFWEFDEFKQFIHVI